MLRNIAPAPAPAPAVYVMPMFVANGTPTLGSGTAVKTMSMPPGILLNDLLLLFVANNNDPEISSPAGWARLTGTPIGSGTPGAAASSGLSVFYKVAAGDETFVDIQPTTSFAFAACTSAFRNVNITNPITVSAVLAQSTGSAVTWPAVDTAFPNSVVVNAASHSQDVATAQFSAWTNNSLTALTERLDISTTANTGAGIAFASGSRAVAGTSGATVATSAHSGRYGLVTFVINPKQE